MGNALAFVAGVGFGLGAWGFWSLYNTLRLWPFLIPAGLCALGVITMIWVIFSGPRKR